MLPFQVQLSLIQTAERFSTSLRTALSGKAWKNKRKQRDLLSHCVCAVLLQLSFFHHTISTLGKAVNSTASDLKIFLLFVYFSSTCQTVWSEFWEEKKKHDSFRSYCTYLASNEAFSCFYASGLNKPSKSKQQQQVCKCWFVCRRGRFILIHCDTKWNYFPVCTCLLRTSWVPTTAVIFFF